MSTTDDTYYLISSGIPILPRNKLIFPESWHEQDRLIDLISKYNKKVLLLSGDVHFSQVRALPCSVPGLPYRLHEVTSSGMTHTCEQHTLNPKKGMCSFMVNTLWTDEVIAHPIVSEYSYSVLTFSDNGIRV